MYFAFVVTTKDGAAFAIKLHGESEADMRARAQKSAGAAFEKLQLVGQCGDTLDCGMPLYEKACVKAEKICEARKAETVGCNEKTGALF